MIRLGSLFDRGTPDERARYRARGLITRAAKEKERGQYLTAYEGLQVARDLVQNLETQEDRELRGLCCLWQAEATIHGYSRPGRPILAKHSAHEALTLCDRAAAEVLPLLARSMSPLKEWRKWYSESHPEFPLGLIEMYRGSAIYFSTTLMEAERGRALAHFKEAMRFLDANSEHGITVRQLLSDVEAANSLADQSR